VLRDARERAPGVVPGLLAGCRDARECAWCRARAAATRASAYLLSCLRLLVSCGNAREWAPGVVLAVARALR